MAMFGLPRLVDTRRRKLRRAGVIVLTFALALPFSIPADAQTYSVAFTIGGTGAGVRAQSFSVLYNFGTNNGDPLQPSFSGIIVQGRDGNLYSTAPKGGANGLGAVFKITPSGKLTVLYSFDGVHGSNPYSGLTLGTGDYFYGTTKAGGASGFGTVFRISTSGSLAVLHNFTNGQDGAQPLAPPVQGTDGNFYGTTSAGGNTVCSGGCGTIYKITPSGVFTTRYQFDSSHGQQPSAPLVLGTDGNFYGTTTWGGTGISCKCGVVFKMTPGGKLNVLFNFNGKNGSAPTAPLIQGADGNFYGTTSDGGGDGVAFRITPGGKIAIICHMHAPETGSVPLGGLVQATDGNLYGADAGGGGSDGNGFGTIFKLPLQGEASDIYNFDGTKAAEPFVTPFQHTDGLLYGDTIEGGTGTDCDNGCGVFYSLDISLDAFVSFLPPLSSGKVGKVIQIFGQGFTGTTAVSFNGTPASFTVKSGTYLTATVPPGATTGPVTVTTPGAVLTSNKAFQVTP